MNLITGVEARTPASVNLMSCRFVVGVLGDEVAGDGELEDGFAEFADVFGAGDEVGEGVVDEGPVAGAFGGVVGVAEALEGGLAEVPLDSTGFGLMRFQVVA